ncbi:MAG TPA: hypothetical protein VK611_05310 [Acidimicrobiales bacterium]|nr:hypothetical protein [Acidimicrobiales bacterium]
MDMSKLAPADAVVALRSLERRYRALFTGLGDDESPDEVAHRKASNGWTGVEHVVAAAWAIAACDRALQRVLREDTPHLDPSDVDPALRDRPGSPTGPVHERLAELGLEANALADRVDGVAAKDWERLGLLDDSSARRVSALDIVRSAVDAGVTHLRAAELTLNEVRA